MKTFFAFSLVCLLGLPAHVLSGECLLENSVYEDADHHEFQLEFGPASGKKADVTHTVMIKHPKRGIIFEFNLSFGMGFAGAFLSPKEEREETKNHRIHFFDEELKSADWEEGAPPYAFIEGLGFADYYGKDTGGREFILGDPMWKFARCRTARPEQIIGSPQTGPTQQLSSAEWIAGGGHIAAYGNIKDLSGKDEGRRYLHIDYVEWLSEDDCRQRVKSGVLQWDIDECDLEVRILNENPQVRKFTVADDVRIIYHYPGQPARTMTWDRLTVFWQERAEDTRELWDGLWKIHRRDGVVEMMEWIYLP